MSHPERYHEIHPVKMNYKYVFLETSLLKPDKRLKTRVSYKKLINNLLRIRPDVILAPGFSIGTLKILIYSLFYKKKFIIWGGTLNKTGLKGYLRRQYHKIIAKKAVGFITYSISSKNYLVSLGLSPNRIKVALNTVDVEYFARAANQIATINKPSEKKHLLYVGYLIKRKNVKKLIDIVKLLSRQRSDFILDIVGEGDQKQDLIDYVNKQELNDFVVFHGFKQKSELPSFYSKAYLFLFQTDYDVWGLVLNEAMASGVTCLSSINAYSTHDLIINGENGFAVNYNNQEGVTKLITNLLDNPELVEKIGRNAQEYVLEVASLDKCADTIISAIQEFS